MIFVNVKTLIMLLPFLNRPSGDVDGPCGRPGARGHQVGDPYFNLFLGMMHLLAFKWSSHRHASMHLAVTDSGWHGLALYEWISIFWLCSKTWWSY